MWTVLIIDDDEKLNQLLEEYLAKHSIKTLSAVNPREGFKLFHENSPDLLILDVMLPEMDGFEILKQIRQTSAVPVIMLTARGDVTDRVVGLELGADDYLPKPFEPRELAARIQSVLRRTQKTGPTGTLESEGLVLDLIRLTAHLNEQPLNLTTNEFEVLSLLMRQAGRVLNRDQIMEELRGLEWDAFNRSIDVTVSRIRQKLGDDPKNPGFIKTIWGAGYKFIAQRS
jgi:DNA-binding response OmpR family regulator